MNEEMERNETEQGKVYPQELATVAEDIRKADAMFSFLGDYSFEAEKTAIKTELMTSANLMLSAGCRLLRMKEHEPHGRFLDAINDLDIGKNTANRLMNVARKFVADNGSAKYPRLLQQSISKIYELALMDDEDLKELDEGKPVADIEVNEIDRMTVRELRAKIREAMKEKEALNKVIATKDGKITEMEKVAALQEQELKDLKEGKKEEPEAPADTSELERELELIKLDSYNLYRKITGLADRVEHLTSGSDKADSAYRVFFGSFKGAVAGIAEEIGRAEDYVGSCIPDSKIPRTGFGFMEAAAEDIKPEEMF